MREHIPALPKALVNMSRQASATLPKIQSWPDRTEALQVVMAAAWQYGLRAGLMVGLPCGVVLTVVIWGMYVATV